MKSYREAVDFLYQIRLFGTRLGLDSTRALCRELDDPHHRLRFVHIAGTNGKGSVGAMIERALRLAGYRTGFFTSPHLVSFRERIRVGGRAIAEADVLRLVREIEPVLDRIASRPGGQYPTFFEVVVALALRHFAEQEAEIVVWETGMGGRLDATNIVDPDLAVITNVQRDHALYLGDSLVQIAAEKAGILKPGVPLVTAADGDPRAVVCARAGELDVPVVHVGDRYRPRILREGLDGLDFEIDDTPVPRGRLRCGLAGRHQARNAAISVAALDILADRGWSVAPGHVEAALRDVRWPGRLHLVDRAPVPVLLDGAHNAPAAVALADSLRCLAGDRSLVLVLGVLQDKDHAEICARLAPTARRIVVAPVHSHRAAEPDLLAAECRRAAPDVPVAAAEDFADALRIADTAAAEIAAAAADAEPLVCVTGSLFLVGEACSRLGIETIDLAPDPPARERGAN